MMNKSEIDWCDFSWNPITGCLHDCPYCYARRQAKRFCGDVRLNKASPQLRKEGDLYVLDKPFHNVNGKVIPLPVGFEPTLHRYRLSAPMEKKLPANIFVGSMADVCGKWIPDDWIYEILDICTEAPQHNYMFLTKNPQRYQDFDDKHPQWLPTRENFWYGTTVNNSADFVSPCRAQILAKLKAVNSVNTFLSIEPLLDELHGIALANLSRFDWVIIGAESGNRKGKVITKREWIKNIIEECRGVGVPVFIKRGKKQKDGTYFMERLMGNDFIQEYPEGLKLSKPPLPKHRVFVESVRDKKDCKHCGAELQGQPATRMGGRYYLCPGCLKEAE